jgi:hypothetical protein
MKNLILQRSLIWLGILCVTLGVVLPFLMVMSVLESTFFLAFLSFILQLGGIIIGAIVTSQKVLEGRRKYKKQAKPKPQEDQESTTGWMK